jgi:hypothetical protein
LHWYSFHDTSKVCRLWRITWQLADVTPYCLELPAKPLQRLCIVPESQQLVYQTRHDIPAQGEARGSIAILLALEPGPLEKWLV